jgi:hypothetical protein
MKKEKNILIGLFWFLNNQINYTGKRNYYKAVVDEGVLSLICGSFDGK